MIKRAVFFRIGWMRDYDGRKPDDPKPIGGGSYNKKHCGDELYNFRAIGGRYYGFCQPTWNSNNIKLEKIDRSWSENELQSVTVVFVAVNRETHPHRQCVVGWYRRATVYRLPQYSPSRIREGKKYIAVARVADSVLLKPDARNWPVKAGTGGIGEANVCYLYHDDGRRKSLRWQKRILKKIEVHRLYPRA